MKGEEVPGSILCTTDAQQRQARHDDASVPHTLTHCRFAKIASLSTTNELQMCVSIKIYAWFGL
jgi:hypothetical protein